jgi:hypothetical protein
MRDHNAELYWLGYARGYQDGMDGSDSVHVPTYEQLVNALPDEVEAPVANREEVFAAALAKAEAKAPPQPEPDPEVARIERFLDRNEVDPMWSVDRMYKHLVDENVDLDAADEPLAEKVQGLRQVAAMKAAGGGTL